jgi:hypothetical protein
VAGLLESAGAVVIVILRFDYSGTLRRAVSAST